MKFHATAKTVRIAVSVTANCTNGLRQ